MENKASQKQWKYLRWFSEDDTEQERRLLVKLDLLIVPYAYLVYWTKYIDQANISESASELLGALRELITVQTTPMSGA